MLVTSRKKESREKRHRSLRKRIEVRKTEQELRGRYVGKPAGPAAKEPAPASVLKEIDDLFGAEGK